MIGVDKRVRSLTIAVIGLVILFIGFIIFVFIRPVGADPTAGTCLSIEKGGTGCNAEELKNFLGISGGSSAEDAYPVGSIFISVDNTNPATSLGFGTWTAFGTGRTLVGYNSGNTLFNATEKIGGDADLITPYHNHGLTGSTTASAGAHTHTWLSGNRNGDTTGTLPGSALGTLTHTQTTSSAGAHTHPISGTVDYTGTSGNATNANYQPFITVFMWKRTN